ncbi:MAG: 4Fe-4S cluster-binding domain-containing protein [Actinobacteria bacterium]|nr:MAG: 4Fe-4S cluster-binding domain-containing protein [Actinomycetota bacterium]
MHLCQHIVARDLDGENRLVYNTLTGAVDILPTHFFKDQTLNLDKIEPIKTPLQKRGYLFSSKTDENLLLKSMVRSYLPSQENKVINFMICPTYSCNLACPYCFEESVKDNHSSLKEKDFDKLIRAILSISKQNQQAKKAIILFGGEPLLPNCKQVVEKVLKLALKLNFPVGIITNGTTLDIYRELLLKYHEAVRMIQVTIDGPQKIHDSRRYYKGGRGSFNKIMGNLSLLIDDGFNIALRVNVDQNNLDSILALSRLFKSLNWHKNKNVFIHLARVSSHNKKTPSCHLISEDKLITFIKEKSKTYPELKMFDLTKAKKVLGHITSVFGDSKKLNSPSFYSCEANYGGFYLFGADGFIYACPEAMGKKDMAIGEFSPQYRLFEDKISLWQGRTILSNKQCSLCNVGPLCGGGCTYEVILNNNRINPSTCKEVKEAINNYLDKTAKEWLKKKEVAKV